jgi:hypothetical protein
MVPTTHSRKSNRLKKYQLLLRQCDDPDDQPIPKNRGTLLTFNEAVEKSKIVYGPFGHYFQFASTDKIDIHLWVKYFVKTE